MDSGLDTLQAARDVFNKEISALEKTRDSLGADFETAADLILHCEGKVVFTGIGKPGHIDSKLSATFASLGIPSFYMHPGEALHGDLGMVEKRDVVILTSYSGESEEVVRLLPVLKEIGCAAIAITGNEKSTLAKNCRYRIILPKFEEACYMHLAPTSSTTALLVLGDALALTVSRARNFTAEDFGLRHPAGALGKKLRVKVSDLMYQGEANAVVNEASSLQSAIVEMSAKGLSMVAITDKSGYLRGIITDGDLRRMLERRVDVYRVSVKDVMTENPKWIDGRELAVNALQKMSDGKITSMPVLNEEKKVIGSILMQDIFKAGIVR